MLVMWMRTLLGIGSGGAPICMKPLPFQHFSKMSPRFWMTLLWNLPAVLLPLVVAGAASSEPPFPVLRAAPGTHSSFPVSACGKDEDMFALCEIVAGLQRDLCGANSNKGLFGNAISSSGTWRPSGDHHCSGCSSSSHGSDRGSCHLPFGDGADDSVFGDSSPLADSLEESAEDMSNLLFDQDLMGADPLDSDEEPFSEARSSHAPVPYSAHLF